MFVTDASPPSTTYNRDYFLSNACEGLRDYLDGGLAALKTKELEYLGVGPAQQFLDLGCGRGETAKEARRLGALVVALDYSLDAVVLTKSLLGDSVVVRADAGALPFRAGTFDRVLLGDVIEHVPWDHAKRTLGEVDRVLQPAGRALVHTSPNTFFIATVKPVLEVLLRVLRRDEVVHRFREYDRLRAAMHPNELNPLRLRKLMKQAGVTARTWVDRDVVRGGASEWTERLHANRAFRAAGALAGAWPLRLVFGNDMFALITKTDETSRGPGPARSL